MEPAAAVLLFWSYCLVMSVLARRESPFLEHAIVHALSVVAFLALLAWAAAAVVQNMASPFISVPSVAGLAIVGVGLGIRYWIFLVGEYFERAHRTLTGVDSMKLEKTYDVAEKLEHEKRYADALALYAVEAGKDPKDAEARRRAGEMCLRLDRIDEASRWFDEAIALTESVENRVTLSFRSAEVLLAAGRREQARALLDRVAREQAGTKFEEFARERLKRVDSGGGAG